MQFRSKGQASTSLPARAYPATDLPDLRVARTPAPVQVAVDATPRSSSRVKILQQHLDADDNDDTQHPSWPGQQEGKPSHDDGARTASASRMREDDDGTATRELGLLRRAAMAMGAEHPKDSRQQQYLLLLRMDPESGPGLSSPLCRAGE